MRQAASVIARNRIAARSRWFVAGLSAEVNS